MWIGIFSIVFNTHLYELSLWITHCTHSICYKVLLISRHICVGKMSLWIKEMIHSFANQLYQLVWFWELGFCNAKVLSYCNTMNTLQPNESFETSEASWRIKASSTASLMEDSNLWYKMFTSQKNSDSQVEGLVLRLVLGQIRAVRLVHVLVAALRFKIQ